MCSRADRYGVPRASVGRWVPLMWEWGYVSQKQTWYNSDFSWWLACGLYCRMKWQHSQMPHLTLDCWPSELSEVCLYSSCYPASGALLWQQIRELKTQWPSIYTAWIHRGLSSNFVFLENLQINFFLSYWENCLCTETLLSRDFSVRLGSPTVSREGEKGRRNTLCFTEEEHWKFMDSGR